MKFILFFFALAVALCGNVTVNWVAGSGGTYHFYGYDTGGDLAAGTYTVGANTNFDIGAATQLQALMNDSAGYRYEIFAVTNGEAYDYDGSHFALASAPTPTPSPAPSTPSGTVEVKGILFVIFAGGFLVMWFLIQNLTS